MNIYDFKAEKNDGEILDFGELKGKVLLIVNTATGCGFTPQYESLERLYTPMKPRQGRRTAGSSFSDCLPTVVPETSIW